MRAGQQGAQHGLRAGSPRKNVWRRGRRGNWDHALLCHTPAVLLLVLLGDPPSGAMLSVIMLTGEVWGKTKLLNNLFKVGSVRTPRATLCRHSLLWNILSGDAAM